MPGHYTPNISVIYYSSTGTVYQLWRRLPRRMTSRLLA